MAKNTVLDWDTTAANNTDVGGININEGCPAGNVNNGMREIMAQARAGFQPQMKYLAKSANYTAVAADQGQMIRFSAAATLSLTAAATLGANWTCYVFANGGDVTVDPNSTETINGATTLTLYDGQAAIIICTGTAFYAINIPTPNAQNRWTAVQVFSGADASGETCAVFNIERAWNVRQRGSGADASLSLENASGKSIELSSEPTYTAPQITFSPTGVTNIISVAGSGQINIVGTGGSFNLGGGSANGVDAMTLSGTNKSFSRNGVASRTQVNFVNDNGTVGTISTSGTATAYNTSSDERLKTFLGQLPAEDAISIIKADPVRRFEWNATGEAGLGWGAQTSYSVSKELATPPESEDGFWSVDLSRRTPYLWAALTWAIAKIEELETRLDEVAQ